jgi:transglutaminase-like putative cysteine protease
MARAAPKAAALADRLLQVSLFGLALSGYLALAGAEYFDLATLLWIGIGLAGLLAVCGVLGGRLRRGYALVVMVAFLELVAAAMVSATVTFFLFLAAFLLLLVATLASAEIRRSTRARLVVARGGLDRFASRLSQLSLFTAIGILALTAGLFFVLPRTAHVAFSGLLAERGHLPGFSREIRLGQIGTILGRSTPAMHVRVVGAAGPPSTKWRGAVLVSFDGKNWRAARGDARRLPVEDGRAILADDAQRRLTGARITYEVQLEPIAAEALFFAGMPEVLWVNSSSVTRTTGGIYRLDPAPRERLRYGAISYLDQPLPEAREQGECLALPALDPRIAALARQVTDRASTDEARAFALEQYLRTNFEYTLELPAKETADPLADFLFERRKGHCEYFASSLAVMLRTIGIPSRLVTGFDGGALNPISGWYVLRASDAHSWVEAWLPNRGWTTLDPTPPARTPRRQALLARFMFYMDAAEMFWQDWVVSYDLERQVTLAARMQSSSRVLGSRWLDRFRLAWLRGRSITLDATRKYGSSALGVVVAAVGLWFAVPIIQRRLRRRTRLRMVQRGEAIASDATLLYGQMLRLLRRRGYSKPAWLTPGEFARSLSSSPTADLVASLTTAYHALRYGGERAAAPRMAALLEELGRRT